MSRPKSKYVIGRQNAYTEMQKAGFFPLRIWLDPKTKKRIAEFAANEKAPQGVVAGRLLQFFLGESSYISCPETLNPKNNE